MTDINHGSHSGYTLCRRRPEGSCQPCKDAKAAYSVDYRQRHPESATAERAYARAKTRLAQLHPEQFEALYRAEKLKLGVRSA